MTTRYSRRLRRSTFCAGVLSLVSACVGDVHFGGDSAVGGVTGEGGEPPGSPGIGGRQGSGGRKAEHEPGGQGGDGTPSATQGGGVSEAGAPADEGDGGARSSGGAGSGGDEHGGQQAGATGGVSVSAGGSGSGGAPAEPCANGTFDHDINPLTACQSWSKCDPGFFVSTLGTITSDRLCSSCGMGTFSSGQNAPECTPHTECVPGEYMSFAGSKTEDSACRICLAGTFTSTSDAVACSVCPEGKFAAASGATACEPWTICRWTEQQSQAGTAMSDAVCGAGSPFRQFGSSTTDRATAVKVDTDGSVYVVGSTLSAFDGEVNSGQLDGYLRKYDASGKVVWTRLMGSSSTDTPSGLAISPVTGDIVVVGTNGASFGGQPHQGNYDVFVRAYTRAGAVRWTKVIGSSGFDYGRAVAIDSRGQILVVGNTEGALESGGTSFGANDVFLGRLDSEGTLLKVKQWGGTGADYGRAVAVDTRDNVAVAGYTTGALSGLSSNGNNDYFVYWFSASDSQTRAKQLGTNLADEATGLAFDVNGALSLVGNTNGVCFVQRLDISGNEVWKTSSTGSCVAVAAQADGTSVVAGTEGAVGFVRAYSTSGSQRWAHTISSTGNVTGDGVAFGASGLVFAVGSTAAALPQQTWIGGLDGYVFQITPP